MTALDAVKFKRITFGVLGIIVIFVLGLTFGLLSSSERPFGVPELTALAQRDEVFEALRMVDYACYFVPEVEDGSYPFSDEIMHINPLVMGKRIHVAGFARLQLFCTPVIKGNEEVLQQTMDKLRELGLFGPLSRVDYACYPLDPSGPADFPFPDPFPFVHLNPELEKNDVVKLGNVNLFCSPVEKGR